jgi:hypothetical protein
MLKIKQKIAFMIWESAEKHKIPLGIFAPKIFEIMLGVKGRKIKYVENKK